MDEIWWQAFRRALCWFGFHVKVDQVWASWKKGLPDWRCDFCKKDMN